MKLSKTQREEVAAACVRGVKTKAEMIKNIEEAIASTSEGKREREAFKAGWMRSARQGQKFKDEWFAEWLENE